MNITAAEADRFWKKTKRVGDCLIWTRSIAGGGYGTVNIQHTNMPSHRVAWILSGKTIPDGFYIMHTCGNKLCCNTDHMVCAKHHGETFRKHRFFSRVKKRKSGCWEWCGRLNVNGYGFITRDYKQVRAHRYSWEIHNGPIAGELCVLHKCDNPRCVNPEHLFLGTRRDNQHDMHSKGRNNQPCGERHFRARLTSAAVKEMRGLPMSHAQLAHKYGVSRATVAAAMQRRTWRHVA